MRPLMHWMVAAALMIAPLSATAQQPAADTQPGQTVSHLPGPIGSPQDVLESARMAFVLADADGNGMISQQEAIDAASLVIGGWFFRADLDGDGVVTRQEVEQIREQVFQQRPILRFVLDRARRDNTPEGVDATQNPTPEQIAQDLGSLLDTNNDNQIQAAEVRQAIQVGVEALYTAADTDRDGQLSPAELNAVMYGAIRAGLQAAFEAADTDNTGALSKEQFAEAMVQPAYTVFDILDRDLDGQLTLQELETAARIALDQLEKLSIDVPRNSPANVIGSNRLPRGADLTTTRPDPSQGQLVAPPVQAPARTLPGGVAPQPR